MAVYEEDIPLNKWFYCNFNIGLYKHGLLYVTVIDHDLIGDWFGLEDRDNFVNYRHNKEIRIAGVSTVESLSTDLTSKEIEFLTNQGYIVKVESKSRLCICEMRELMIKGCTCGGN